MIKDSSTTKYEGVYMRYGHPYIRYDTYTPDGKRCQKNESCKGMTPAQAYKYRQKLIAKLQESRYKEPSTETVTEYLERWFTHAKQNGLEDTTQYGYRYAIDRIVPHIGKSKLNDLKPIALQELMTTLKDEGGVHGGKLSAKTVWNIYGVLHRALDQAAKWQLIPENPLDRIDPPKKKRREGSSASIEDIAALLNAFDKSNYRVALYIALCTGLRRGEIVGLKWSDVDFKREIILVRKSISQVPNLPVTEKSIKNEIPRSVALTPTLIAELQLQKQMQAKNKKLYGSNYIKSDYVCTWDNGKHITPAALSQGMHKIKTKLGITVSLHVLRHTMATLLVMSGVPVNTAAEQMGHDPAVMLRIYAHVMPQSRQLIVDTVEHMIAAAKKHSKAS